MPSDKIVPVLVLSVPEFAFLEISDVLMSLIGIVAAVLMAATIYLCEYKQLGLHQEWRLILLV